MRGGGLQEIICHFSECKFNFLVGLLGELMYKWLRTNFNACNGTLTYLETDVDGEVPDKASIPSRTPTNLHIDHDNLWKV